jgi:hypothetical protein
MLHLQQQNLILQRQKGKTPYGSREQNIENKPKPLLAPKTFHHHCGGGENVQELQKRKKETETFIDRKMSAINSEGEDSLTKLILN